MAERTEARARVEDEQARTSVDADRTREAWERLVHGDGFHDELLRAPVRRAWRRSDALGASARMREARALSPVQLAMALDREHDLLDAARPYLRALSRAAGAENHAAMLGDHRGIVLDLLGDSEHVEAPGFPRAGALLDEARSGANGIGTPLAEGAYVELVGPEHYIEGFHPYTCQGLPIRDPDGAIAGVLSMSVRRVQAAESVREILVCAARGVEAELMRRRLEQDVARLLRTDLSVGEPFERLKQDVVQLQARARLKIETAAVLAARRASTADTLRLLLAAEALVEQFRRRSLLWRELASEGTGTPLRLDVQAHVVELAALLATESAIRRVSLLVAPREPLEVRIDPRSLSRALFRAILRAIDASPSGGTVAIRTVVEDGCARIEVSPLDTSIELGQVPEGS